MRTHNDPKHVEQPIEKLSEVQPEDERDSHVESTIRVYKKILLCHQTLYSLQRVPTLGVYQAMKWN